MGGKYTPRIGQMCTVSVFRVLPKSTVRVKQSNFITTNGHGIENSKLILLVYPIFHKNSFQFFKSDILGNATIDGNDSLILLIYLSPFRLPICAFKNLRF